MPQENHCHLLEPFFFFFGGVFLGCPIISYTCRSSKREVCFNVLKLNY